MCLWPLNGYHASSQTSIILRSSEYKHTYVYGANNVTIYINSMHYVAGDETFIPLMPLALSE